MASRFLKITLGGVTGAFIGSFTGVVALGGGVAGGIIFGPLAAYIVYLYTKTSSVTGETDVAVPEKENSTVNNSFKELEETASGGFSLLVKVLALLWNILMHLFIRVRIMSFFKKAPWTLVVAIICLMALMAPLALLFMAMGFVAIDNGIKPENDFMISVQKNNN